MSTCIVCSKEVHIDDGYATDGKIFVCRHCAETETLRTVTVYISNAGVESMLVYKREAPIEMTGESGLVDQTDMEGAADNHEFTPDEIAEIAKAPKYLRDKINAHVELDKSLIDERDGSTIPNGCSKSCPYWPYDTCGHYYGELHECMLEEESEAVMEIAPKADVDREVDADIENMSEEDFVSKYCDNPYALEKWAEAHLDGPAFQ